MQSAKINSDKMRQASEKAYQELTNMPHSELKVIAERNSQTPIALMIQDTLSRPAE